MKLDNPPDGSSLTDLVATLLGNVFKTLIKKADYFDPEGKVKISRSMVSVKGDQLLEYFNLLHPLSLFVTLSFSPSLCHRLFSYFAYFIRNFMMMPLLLLLDFKAAII